MASILPNSFGRGIGKFTYKERDEATRAEHALVQVPIERNVIMFMGVNTGDESTKAGNTFKAAAHNLAMARTAELLSDQQRATFYLGAAYCLISSSTNRLENALKSMGLGLRVYHVPTDQDQSVELFPADIPDVKLCIINMAVIVLCMYKNINDANYKIFVDNRMKALRSLLGIPDDDYNSTRVFVDLSAAKSFRNIIGGNYTLKKDILDTIFSLSGGTGPLERAFDYVCGILAWTDMAPLVFINQQLLIPNSPVLRQPEVTHEVIALARGLAKVCAFEHPQFFRISSPPSHHRFVERSNFPILMAVARKLKEGSQPNVMSFNAASNVNADLVDRLANMHQIHFQTAVERRCNIDNLVNVLTNYNSTNEEEATVGNTHQNPGARQVTAMDT